MANNQTNLPGYEGKDIVIFTRRHWASLLGTIVLVSIALLFPAVILIVIFFTRPDMFSGVVLNLIVITASIYYFVMTTYAFTEFISYYYDVIIVTADVIIDIDQNGIFDRRISEVTVIRIQDVSARVHGFMQTFFGYGDVVAESAGEKSQTYVLDSIPRPVEVANKILELHNAQIEKEHRQGEILTAEGDLRGTKIEPLPSPPPPPQPPPQESPTPPPQEPPTNSTNSSGDISKDDLNKGGEIKF